MSPPEDGNASAATEATYNPENYGTSVYSDRLADALAEDRASEARLSRGEKAARRAEYERQRLRLAAAGLASPDGFIRTVAARFLLARRGAA